MEAMTNYTLSVLVNDDRFWESLMKKHRLSPMI